MRITKIGIPPGGDINQVLVKSSGTDYDVEWGTGSGTATPPGGLNTQVQFNDGGVFGGDAGFTYNKTTNRLTLGSLVLNDVIDPGVDTDKFLVLTSLGVVSYRNGASVLVDIGGVPTTRTLTINGTSYDLSQNRTWSVGTVTSVGLSAPTGFSVANSPVTGTGTLALSFASGYSLPTTASQTNWDTAYTNRITSLTTTGSSGAATLISNTLNIPNYTLSGLGGVPTGRTITINGTAQDLSLDRTYSVGTVTSVSALTLGTTGTDLSSSVANGTTTPVITLNVPTASATNRGALSSADWSTFNGKENVLTFSSPLSRSTNTISIPAATGSVNGYLTSTDWTTFNGKQAALNGTGFVKISGTTISYDNSTYYLASNPNGYTSNVGTVTSISTSAPITGGTITGSGTIGITQASGSSNGYLSSTDWTTFNNKQNALTNPVTGTGTSGQVAYFNGTTSITSESNLFWDATNDRLGIGVNSPAYKLDLYDSAGNFLQLYHNDGTYNRRLWITSTASGTNQGITLNATSSTAGDNLIFQTANNERGRFTANGLLIGTTTDAGYKLDVNGTGRFSDELYLENGKYINFKRNSGGLYIGTLGIESGTDDVRLLTSGNFYIKNGSLTNLVTVTNGGNLGLGVTPTVKLQVETPSTGNGVIFRYTGGTNNPGLFIQTEESSKNVKLIASGSVVGGQLLQLGAEGSTCLNIGANNIGLGVTPSAWISTRKAIQLNSPASAITGVDNGVTEIWSNSYIDSGATSRYISNGYANVYQQNFDANGGFRWLTAPSGTAGNAISFTQAMTLTANGDLIIGSGADTGESLQVTGGGKLTDQVKIIGGNIDVLNFKFNSSYGNTNIGVTFDSGSDAGNSLSLKVNNAAGTATERLKLLGNGQLKLNNYTTTTSFSGTPVGLLAFEADGDIVTTSISGAGGVGGSGTTNYIPKFTGSSTIGDSSITDNGTTVELLQGQLRFPATQNPSSDANTLDDYEEGDWTPTYLPGTNSFTTITYNSARSGRYQKIGRKVFVSGYIATDSLTIGTGGGSLQIGGLPFTHLTTPECAIPMITFSNVLLWDANPPSMGTTVGLSAGTKFILHQQRDLQTSETANCVPGDMTTGAFTNQNRAYFYGSYDV